MLAAIDAMAADERTTVPVLPPTASAYEAQLQWGSPIEEVLMPHLHPGRFVAGPSVVTSMGAAMKVNYTTKNAMRLYVHFKERKDGAPIPETTHTYVGASRVLYLHEDVARIFALWLATQGRKKRAENERQSKKRAAASIAAPSSTTTAPATLSSSSSPESTTTSPSLPLQEVDTNIITIPPAAAQQPKPAKCKRTEKEQEEAEEQERAISLATLKRRISELHENAQFLLGFTKADSLPVDKAADEVTELLLAFERTVVARAYKDVNDYLTQYCPAAISKIDWVRLSYRTPAAPVIPDVDQIFSQLHQPIPNPVPLIM